MNGKPNRLLVVDDEPEVCRIVKAVAEEVGYEVYAAHTGTDFMRAYGDIDPTVIMLDLNMPGSDGVEHLRYLAAQGSRAKIFLMSGVDGRILASAERLGDSRGLDMLGTLQKPMPVPVLQKMLEAGISAERSVTETDLRLALDERRLAVHYQPKITICDGGSGKFEAVEALVRWEHPEYGMRFPDEFIPLAERTGLIAPLTDYVLGETLKQVRSWMDQGLHLKAAVNLPASMVDDNTLPDSVAATLHSYEVPNEYLTLEVTESGAMADTEATTSCLTRFRIKGVDLAIDDFGTGFSSLVQLYRMPFSELKVDRSFVMACDRDAEARTIVEVIVSLGQKMGLSVCAEGVETLSTWKYLHSLGCHKAQGYYMGRPVPAPKIADLAANWKVDMPTEKPYVAVA